MEIIAAVSIGLTLTAFAAGVSWLALEGFFYLVGRSLTPSAERERVESNDGLIPGVDGLAGLATQ